MGLVLALSGLFGAVIGLAIAAASIAGFVVFKARRQRGNPLAFLGMGLLGFALSFTAAAIVSAPLFSDQPTGVPNYTLQCGMAFALGLSPAGFSLGLLALRAKPG